MLGATFQRALDINFHGLINQSVVVYLVDVTVFSKNKKDHCYNPKKHHTGLPGIKPTHASS
jgi:hypothetical protein